MASNELPLLLRSVRLAGDNVALLDETALPLEERWLESDDVNTLCRYFKEMRSRGLGQMLLALETLCLTARQHEGQSRTVTLQALKQTGAQLAQARGTLRTDFLTEMVLTWADNASQAGADPCQEIEERKQAFLTGMYHGIGAIARSCLSLLSRRSTILTHCCVGGALAMLARYARQGGQDLHFVVTETRPFFQGARLTAYELRQEGMPVTLIADNAVLRAMADVDAVIVGADRVAANGDIVNKIGTCQLALAARHNDVPFYAFSHSFIKDKVGSDVPIEIRDPFEVLTYRGAVIAPGLTEAYYPAFDITPGHLVTRIILQEGIFLPEDMARFLK